MDIFTFRYLYVLLYIIFSWISLRVIYSMLFSAITTWPSANDEVIANVSSTLLPIFSHFSLHIVNVLYIDIPWKCWPFSFVIIQGFNCIIISTIMPIISLLRPIKIGFLLFCPYHIVICNHLVFEHSLYTGKTPFRPFIICSLYRRKL